MQVVSYSVRLVSPERENSCLIPASAALSKKRFTTIEALIAALRREIELHCEPWPRLEVEAGGVGSGDRRAKIG